MTSVPLEPNRKMLENAVRSVVGNIMDKSSADIRLRGLCQAEWNESGRGDASIVPFRSGASDTCYALRVQLCEEGHPLGVGVHSTYAFDDDIAKWATELWERWEQDGEEFDLD